MQKLSARDMVLIGLFAAMLCVLSQIAIPLPSGVPITLQTFAVALCGFVLGAKAGTLAVLVFLLMGGIGLPVFSNFTGGIGIFLGVTGGFLWGFLPLAALCGTKKLYWAAMGLLLCHALGAGQFSLVTGTPFIGAVTVVSLPYLVKDAASVLLAVLAAKPVRRGLTAARFAPR